MSEFRGEQLGSVLHRAIQRVIASGLSDPRLESLITVTSVRVTEDRQTALVGVSVMPEKHESRVIHGLRDAARHIRRRVGDMVEIHKMPELVFKLDRSAKAEAELLEAMARVRAEREAHGEVAPAEVAPSTDIEENSDKNDGTNHEQG